MARGRRPAREGRASEGRGCVGGMGEACAGRKHELRIASGGHGGCESAHGWWVCVKEGLSTYFMTKIFQVFAAPRMGLRCTRRHHVSACVTGQGSYSAVGRQERGHAGNRRSFTGGERLAWCLMRGTRGLVAADMGLRLMCRARCVGVGQCHCVRHERKTPRTERWCKPIPSTSSNCLSVKYDIEFEFGGV